MAESVAAIHEAGYAAGDFDSGDNIIVLGKGQKQKAVFCDLIAGPADNPNEDRKRDFGELRQLAELIFNRRIPSSVTTILTKYQFARPHKELKTMHKMSEELKKLRSPTGR